MPGIPENGCGDILMQTKVLPPFRLVNPEMFATFVMVSFQKSPTNISNDMTKNLILAAAMLLAGGAVAAQPKVIAHRGYWTAPESAQNSIASFTKADAVGVFGSEIDVWLTADDKLIVNHDRIYKGTDVNMEKATAKEITAIVLPNGENIPTFDAYLKLVASKPDTRLILEMKSLSDYNREDLAAKKDRQAAQEIRRAGPDGDHRLLDQRLHGIQEAHSRHQNLLPQRRPGSQEHQETGAGRHRLLDGRLCASIPNG